MEGLIFISRRKTEEDRLRAAIEAQAERERGIKRYEGSKAHKDLVRAQDATNRALERELRNV